MAPDIRQWLIIKDRFRGYWGTIYFYKKVNGWALWVQDEAKDDDQGYWLGQVVKIYISVRFEIRRKYNFGSKDEPLHISYRFLSGIPIERSHI